MPFWKIGLAIGIAIPAAGVLWEVLSVVDSDTGFCGGGMFFGGTRHPCSMWEHVSRRLELGFVLTLGFFWWAILLVLFIPTLIGFLIDRAVRAEPSS